MAALECPVCGSPDIRFVRTVETVHHVTGSGAGDGKPKFTVEKDPFETNTTDVVTCVNGHAHPARVGFEVEWS